MYRQLIEEERTIRRNQFHEILPSDVIIYCQNSLQTQLIWPIFTTTDVINFLNRGVSLPTGIAPYCLHYGWFFGPPGQILETINPCHTDPWEILLTTYTRNPAPDPSHKWRGDHAQLPWTVRGDHLNTVWQDTTKTFRCLASCSAPSSSRKTGLERGIRNNSLLDVYTKVTHTHRCFEEITPSPATKSTTTISYAGTACRYTRCMRRIPDPGYRRPLPILRAQELVLPTESMQF
jgi:hypothetical protein